MTNRRHQPIAALCLAVLMAVTGCQASDNTSAEGTSPPTRPMPSATAAPSPAPAAARFTSRTFAIPFTATVPGSFKPVPTEQTQTLVSWSAVTGDRYIRVLLPAVLYQPGSTTPQPPPKDYLAYLRGLTAAGASFTNETSTTVSGHPATLITGTASDALDGTLGCPQAQTPIEVCFGLQPELTLRIAVIPVGTRTLLAWARTGQDDPEAKKYFAEFEAMLDQAKLA
jgi:hypothetical protein